MVIPQKSLINWWWKQDGHYELPPSSQTAGLILLVLSPVSDPVKHQIPLPLLKHIISVIQKYGVHNSYQLTDYTHCICIQSVILCYLLLAFCIFAMVYMLSFLLHLHLGSSVSYSHIDTEPVSLTPHSYLVFRFGEAEMLLCVISFFSIFFCNC